MNKVKNFTSPLVSSVSDLANPVISTVSNLKAPTESVLNNVYVSGFLKIFIILYAVLAAPQLPPSISKYFHHPMVQIIIFALIAYTATKDIGISLLIAIAFFVSFHSYTKNLLSRLMSKTKNLFKLNVKEKYSLGNAPALSEDSLLDSSSIATSSNTKTDKLHQLNSLVDVMPYNEPREINSVQNGLLKDQETIASNVADAQLLDPYKASMVPSSSNLAGFNL